MATILAPAPSVNNPPGIRLIRDEEAPPYDGQPRASPRPHMRITHEIMDRYQARAGPTAWSVFCVLMRHADSATGRSWPSHTTIAAATGVKKRQTIMAALNRLAELGMIRIVIRPGTSCVYFIECRDDCSLADNLSENRTPPVQETDTTCTENRTPPVPKIGHELTPLNKNQLTTTVSTPQPPKGGKKGKEPDPRFDEFYEVWPKKRARDDAERAWAKLKPDDALFAVIMERARLYRQHTPRNRINYIPNAATFLNGKRWTDDPPGPEQPHANGVAPKGPNDLLIQHGAKLTVDEYRGRWARKEVSS